VNPGPGSATLVINMKKKNNIKYLTSFINLLPIGSGSDIVPNPDLLRLYFSDPIWIRIHNADKKYAFPTSFSYPQIRDPDSES
jgi:hypothetical protein